MRPILFEIFDWEVPSWHFFFVMAAFAAFFVARFCARRAESWGVSVATDFLDGLPTLFVICYLGGWFGARALSLFVEQMDVQGVSAFFSELFQIGPMTFYGGALCAIFLGVSYCWWRRISLPFAFDCGILGGVFALGIGRIGCHFNGDDFGAPVANQFNPPFWAVRFSILEDGGLYRYPVQLQETFFSFFLTCVGLWLFRRCYFHSPRAGATSAGHANSVRWTGAPAALLGLLSAANRYVNEIFRGDPRGFFPGTQISTSSGIALLIVIS